MEQHDAMEWSSDAMNSAVKWLRKNRYFHDVDLHLQFMERLICELLEQGKDYLLLKWQNGLIVTYSSTYRDIYPSSDFPLAEIVGAIHSYAAALKEFIAHDEEYWDERWRNEALIHVEQWAKSYDINDQFVYESLSREAEQIKLEMARWKESKRSPRDKRTFRGIIFGSDKNGLYGECISAMNGAHGIKGKIKAFEKFREAHRGDLHFWGIKNKGVLYDLMMADGNTGLAKLGCSQTTFLRYYHTQKD